MNAGLKILVERMKTNPEEFCYGGKWAEIIERYKQYFSTEEMRQITEAKRQMYMDEFAGVVMAKLAGSPVPEEETLAYRESEKFIREVTEAEYRAKMQQELMDRQRMLMNAAQISNPYPYTQPSDQYGNISLGEQHSTSFREQLKKRLGMK